MWWMLAIQAGMSVLSSVAGGKAGSVQENLQLADRYEQARLQNEEVARANKINLSNTMFNQGMLKMQDGLAKQQNLRNRLSLGIGEAKAKAEVSLNQAVFGTVGASADAVLNDVHKSFTEANEELARQRQLESFQTSSGIQQAYTQYYQNLGKLDSTGKGIRPSSGGSLGTHLMGGLISTGSSYLSKNVSLGLGSKPSGNGINLISQPMGR